MASSPVHKKEQLLLSPTAIGTRLDHIHELIHCNTDSYPLWNDVIKPKNNNNNNNNLMSSIIPSIRSLL